MCEVGWEKDEVKKHSVGAMIRIKSEILAEQTLGQTPITTKAPIQIRDFGKTDIMTDTVNHESSVRRKLISKLVASFLRLTNCFVHVADTILDL